MLRRLGTLLILLASAPAGVWAQSNKAESAEDAYQAARKGYYALKADEKHRKFRHNWQNVAKKFDAVAQRYPKSERAPDALFTAAQLFEDLSQISRLPEDLDAATADYRKLMDAYPSHRLCDDAALAMGRIELDRVGKPEAARKILTDALQKYPKGDRAREIKAVLATLPAAEEVEPAPKRISARVPAEDLPTVSPVVTAIAKLEQSAPPAPPPVRKAEPPPVALVPPEPKPAPVAEAPAKPALSDPKTAKERLKVVSRKDPEVTLADELGLKVRRVVIDAGHGGHDTGAVGPGGTKEKDVTLALAHRVGELLADQGLDVLLTRDTDAFVRLEDRARIANEAKGDLFISIHCNSNPTDTYRGVETYTLNTSADRYSIRLAARENSSSEKGISDLQFILADLATKANTDESQRLATRVQHSLVNGLRARNKNVHDLGTKEALFYVLLGAKMPAILVETSFLSNPDEEKLLASKPYQEDVAQGIVQGVEDFLSHREQVAKVP